MTAAPAKPFSIRQAVPADAADLARMHLRLQEHLEASNPLVWGMSESRREALPGFYVQEMKDPTVRVLLARDRDARPLGFATGALLEHPETQPERSGTINDVWVEPGNRGYGLCRALVSGLMQFFDASGIEDVHLKYIVGNAEAEAVWRRLGFTPVVVTALARRVEAERQL